MISALLFTAAAVGNFRPPSFTPDDARQLQEGYRGGEPGIVLIDAHVDPKGQISDCKAQSVSGSKSLAESICKRAERLRMKPASIDGSSSHGVVRSLMTFSDSDPSGHNGAKLAADLILQVNKLPAGESSLRVVANVLINAEGKPQACYAANDAPKAYADVACSQISPITFGVLKDNDGKPVRYVREVILDFTTTAPSSSG